MTNVEGVNKAFNLEQVIQSQPSAIPSVEYHIVHSPIYQVPVLYFFLHNFPTTSESLIELVYKYVVPQIHKAHVQDVGVMGAISFGVSSRSPLARLCVNLRAHRIIHY